MAKVYREFAGDVTPPQPLQQDDPAGAYLKIDVDAAFSDSSIPRAVGMIGVSSDAGVSPALMASEMSAVGADGSVVGCTIGEVFADSPFGIDYDLGIHVLLEGGVRGPLITPDEVSAITLVNPPQVGQYIVNAFDIEKTTVSVETPPIVTTGGNSLLCAVAWDSSGGASVTSIVRSKGGVDSTYDLVSTTVIGGAGNYTLGVYILKNQLVTNVLQALPTLVVTMSAPVSAIRVVCLEVSNCVADPLDASTTASGSDELPVTPASAETVAANEAIVSFMLISGNVFADAVAPAVPEGVVFIGAKLGGEGAALSLYAYRQNIIAIDNVGFSATLSEARDWAVAVHSFQ